MPILRYPVDEPVDEGRQRMDRTYADLRSRLMASVMANENPDERSTDAERVWSLAKQQGDGDIAAEAFVAYRSARRESRYLIDGTEKTR